MYYYRAMLRRYPPRFIPAIMAQDTVWVERMMRRIAWLWFLIGVVSLAGCNALDDGSEPVPTKADINTLPTHQFLTANAPPAGFGQVNVDPIDANLSALAGWHYTITGQFNGTFDATGALATGTLSVEVWANQVGETRRVVLAVEGAALSPDDAKRRLEGVRWSNDYYIVDTNGQCTVGGDGAEVIGNLSAGQMIGGVINAVPTGHRQTIGAYPAWQYTFRPEEARFPAVHRDANSRVSLEADLWIAPDLNAVVRYEVRLTVTGVRLLSSDQPVSGTLYMRYDLDLDQVDTQPNISVPHGC